MCPSSLQVDTIACVHIASMTHHYTRVQTATAGRLRMNTRFIKINDGWNAEPNAPAPVVTRSGDDVVLGSTSTHTSLRSFPKVIADAWSFVIAGVIAWAGTNDEGWASVDSAKSHLHGESSIRFRAI